MAKSLTHTILAVSAVLVLAASVRAQAGPATGPAPAHDLSGVWSAAPVPSIRGFIGDTWTKEEPSLTPWGAARYKEAKASNGSTYTLDKTNDPVITKCLPPGVPRIYMHPFPFQIAQLPKEILVIYEYDHTVRHVYTDGRAHNDPDPTFMGESIGHWEGDTTFVVDTVGFNDRTWLDRLGHPHSDQLHVIERFRRVDRDNLQIDITMEDAKALAKPWSQTIYYRLRPTWEIHEQDCTENSDFVNFENNEAGPAK
jgi:hypothetical protein